MICYLFMFLWVRTQSQKLLKNTACVTVSIRSIFSVIGIELHEVRLSKQSAELITNKTNIVYTFA